MLTHPAALVFCVVLVLLGAFQLALAARASWGRFAWGGGHQRPPPALRIASLVSILIYAVFAIIVLESAGMIAILPSTDIVRIGNWVIAGYWALGIIMNAISLSKPER